jgi:hypothetical protein
MTGKGMELVDTMIRRKVNIACLQETKWVGEKAREIENTGFKFYYTGKHRNKNGVGIIVDMNFKDDIVTVIRKGDRLILVKLVLGENIINIVSAYAPQVGLDEHTKVQFWEQMDELIQEIPLGEKIYIGGDFNGHVGEDRVGYEIVHGGHGFGDRNDGGESILDFTMAYDFVLVNTCFKKRTEHLITYKSGTHKSQIDFFITRKGDRLTCKDCKVIPGENLTSQHRIMVLDIDIKNQSRVRKVKINPRTRWWNLKGEKLELFKDKVLNEATWNSEEETNIMWNKMATCIRRISKEILGESKGKGPQSKETWWWNEEVQNIVKIKRECFKTWQTNRNEENFEKYKWAKKEVKKVVRDAKLKAYDDLYTKLGTQEGKKSIYKLAKLRDRKTKDFNNVKCIKSDDSRVLVKDDEIMERWKNYFERLLNGDDGCRLDIEELRETRENIFFRRIRTTEVRIALKKMKTGKALGPDGIPIEVWKCLGEDGVSWPQNYLIEF